MKKSLFLSLLVLLTGVSFGQELKANWSDKEFYTNKTTGFFDQYVGGNSKYVYLKTSKLPGFAMSNKKRERRTMINMMAYDKATMKEVAKATILDLSNSGTKKKYGGLRYYKTIVFENSLYVFWVSDEKKKDELYVESYTPKLKRTGALKKVYELSSSKEAARKAEIFALGNQAAGEKIIIGGELATNDGQNIKMEYKLLNADFTFAAANQVTLPVAAVRNSRSRSADNLSSSYLFGDDANLHIRSYVTVDEKEKKDLNKKGAATSFAIYSIVEVNSGKIHSFSMRSDDKNILEFNFAVTKSSIKVYGFFNDIAKGGLLNGIFTGAVDPKAFTMSALNFTYFTKTQLDALFAKDKEDANKAGALASNKKKEAKEKEEALTSNFRIEDVKYADNDNLVLFCSRMLNTTQDYYDGKNWHSIPICQKDNVTIFKINATKGEIVWASNLDRRASYGGWFVDDLKVITKDKNFYIVYGNAYNSAEQASGKTKKKRKSKDQREDRFEYAVLDQATGTIKRKEFTVNAVNAPKGEIKHISAVNLKVIDNEFYANSTKGKLKLIPTILSFVGCFICPPVVIMPFVVPSYKKWTVYNGKICPM